MSGPKVVRVVTRAELLEVCRASLARTDAAIAEWERVARRNDVHDSSTSKKISSRRALLDRMLGAGRFSELPNEARRLEEWLGADLDARLEAKAAAEQKARQAHANLQATAGSLLRSFANTATPIPDDLRTALEEGAHTDVNDGIGAMNAAIARAFRLLSDIDQPGEATPKQQELAERLGRGEVRLSVDDWLTGRDIVHERVDQRLTTAERLMSQLAAFAGTDAITEYTLRIDALRAEKDAARRELQIDALCLALADAVEAARGNEMLRRETLVVRAETQALGGATRFAAAFAELERLITVGDMTRARHTLNAIREAQARETKDRAAAVRREAILRGLTQLGYEVREGMMTAWVKDGRLAIKNPALPGYGVELAGNTSTDRLQARAVVFEGVAPQAIPGLDVERRWCADFARLQDLLAAQGGELVIEHATPAGAQPLRAVPDEWRQDDDLTSPEYRTIE